MSTSLNQLNGSFRAIDTTVTPNAEPEKTAPVEPSEVSLAGEPPVELPTNQAAAKDLEFIGSYQALRLKQAAPAPPADKKVNTPLPDSDNYYRYSPKTNQYGRESTIRALQDLAKTWAATHSSRLNIGDISLKGGGKLGRSHQAHRTGIDADIRPIRKDGANSPTNIHDPNYDREATRELVLLIKKKYPNAVILFNDPALIKEGLTKPYVGHDNHLHVSFK